MKNGEFSDAEQLALASLDFYRYDDPVAKSISNWHAACDRWNNQLRLVQWGEGGRTQAQANMTLTDFAARYAHAFFEAASHIAADSPIEEKAIDALEHLFRTEEERRLTHIGYWYKTDLLQPSSDEYFRDIVMPFADPEGKTLVHVNDEPVLSQEAAVELYRARLEEHARTILDQRQRTMREYKPSHRGAQRFYAVLGAIGLSSLWVIVRGKKSKRQ